MVVDAVEGFEQLRGIAVYVMLPYLLDDVWVLMLT